MVPNVVLTYTTSLYGQMEYCEKNTLRQLIDTGELHKNMDDVWMLFRELVEGLAHIHSRVCIHFYLLSYSGKCGGERYQVKLFHLSLEILLLN